MTTRNCHATPAQAVSDQETSLSTTPTTAASATATRLQVEGFFDPATWTVSYLVLDTQTMQCALVDSVLDFDPKSGRTDTASADRLIARVQALGAHVQWILETHVHADHLSAAPYLQKALGGRLGIGQQITTVQNVFGTLFNAGPDFARDGSQFDHLFTDGERFVITPLLGAQLATAGSGDVLAGLLALELAEELPETLDVPIGRSLGGEAGRHARLQPVQFGGQLLFESGVAAFGREFQQCV